MLFNNSLYIHIGRLNKILADSLGRLVEPIDNKASRSNKFAGLETLYYNPDRMKKYFSEKNALTVMVSLFCLIMMIVSLAKGQSVWEVVAFALAFSFSVELICHRARENK